MADPDYKTLPDAHYPALGEYDENPEHGTTPREEILTETITHITGDRNTAYGEPTKNFSDTAKLWNVLFDGKMAPGAGFVGSDVALAMTALKQARLINEKKHKDTWGDGAGYFATGYECAVSENAAS